MARTRRFTVDFGNYHVLCRGHNKREIFHAESDFLKYWELLLESKSKNNLKIYHYVLMNNHIHLILMSPKGSNLINAMRDLNQTYAQYYRKKYGGIGYVWQDRYKSFLIQNGMYLLECGRYIELNPVRAGIISNPLDYRWSSCRVYISSYKDSLVDMSPEYLGLSKDSENRKNLYSEFLKDGLCEKRGLLRYFREGTYGSKDFVESITTKGLKSVNWRLGRPHKLNKR